MKIPLVADTRRTISVDYGVLKEDEGIAYRYVLQYGVMLFHYESKNVRNNEASLLVLLLLNISLKVPPCISGSEGRSLNGGVGLVYSSLKSSFSSFTSAQLVNLKWM